MLPVFHYTSGSQSVVLGLEVAVVPPENLFEMQFLGHIPGLQNHKLGVGFSSLYVNKPSKGIRSLLWFENHWIFQTTCISLDPPYFLLLLYLSLVQMIILSVFLTN